MPSYYLKKKYIYIYLFLNLLFYFAIFILQVLQLLFFEMKTKPRSTSLQNKHHYSKLEQKQNFFQGPKQTAENNVPSQILFLMLNCKIVMTK